MKTVSLVAFCCLWASAVVAASGPSLPMDQDEAVAAAALQLCVAVRVERLDDGKIPTQNLADAIIEECRDEIETLAGFTARSEADGDLFRDEVRQNVLDMVQGFRGESQL